MTERLLQFIWQFQYFNSGELATSSGEELQVLFPGHHNANQGPDFLDAKVRIGSTTWAGTVELHLKSSDWEKHHHQQDRNYKNVILHVVWEDDKGGPSIPVFELNSRVSKIVLQRYEELMHSSAFIPCEKNLHLVRDIIWKNWKERLLAERLLRKAKAVGTNLQENNFHWEETFWWWLARNFGLKINAESFEAVARSIPLSILARHKGRILQLEALLLGQAGLLDEKFSEDYPEMLQKEYRFYQNKYKLEKVPIQPLFLRMRPGNFPGVRLAQLAMLVFESEHLFSKIKDTDAINDVKIRLDVTANDYWHYHYRFGETSSFKRKKLGASMINNVIINTVVPLLFTYGDFQDENKYKEKALRWLEETAAENNSITHGFSQLEIENKNAFDSQALIELKNEYCDKRRCLDCAVGNYLLKKD